MTYRWFHSCHIGFPDHGKQKPARGPARGSEQFDIFASIDTSDNGAGIDEVMTVVSGGPFTWMFVLPDAVIARLTVFKIAPEGPAVRLSYPGFGMHAGSMDPRKGIIVAYAHGPENFVIRFEEPTARNAQLLGSNPWVDFTGDVPKLHERVV